MADLPELALLSTEELLACFASAAVAYETAEAQEDFDETDRQDMVKYRIFREVRRRGRDAEMAFLGLLTHENRQVRAESAMYAIKISPPEAIPVLTDIGRLRGRTGYYARQTLNRYLLGADGPQCG